MIESNKTREHWLNNAIELLRPVFKQKEWQLPAIVKASVGFPSKSAMAKRNQVIGQCWDSEATSDGIAQIYITPLINDSVKVLDVLVHELYHAVVGSKCKHKGEFGKIARALGLEGKLTSTNAGEELLARLNIIVSELGKIPHGKLNPLDTLDKKQTTRMLKAECVKDEYIVRGSRKVFDRGMPICPVCKEPMVNPEGDMQGDEPEDESEHEHE